MKNLTKKNTKEYNKCSGIYKIIIERHTYIGSSKNIKNRLNSHLNSMKSGKHHNKTIQNCFNKYGEDKIFFEIVEKCSEDILIIREKYYINDLNPDMNHILDPEEIVRDNIYKQRISKSKKKYFETHDPVNCRKVYQYTIEGNYISEFKSITEAAKRYNIDVSAICSVCNNRSQSSVNYRWSFNKLDKLDKLIKKYKQVPIIQLSKNDEFIKEWESKTIAEKELNICNISRAIKEGRCAGGFKWKRKI